MFELQKFQPRNLFCIFNSNHIGVVDIVAVDVVVFRFADPLAAGRYFIEPEPEDKP